MQQVELCLNCRNFYRQLTQPNQPDTNFLSRFHLFLFRVVLAFLKMHLHNNRHCYPKHCRQIPIRLCWGSKPNITGTTYAGMQYGSPTGAFSLKASQGLRGREGSNYGYADMAFNASKSSSLYSKNTVQPKAIQNLMIIKI